MSDSITLTREEWDSKVEEFLDYMKAMEMPEQARSASLATLEMLHRRLFGNRT